MCILYKDSMMSTHTGNNQYMNVLLTYKKSEIKCQE